MLRRERTTFEKGLFFLFFVRLNLRKKVGHGMWYHGKK